MIEQKNLLKLKKFIDHGSKGLNLTKTLLCAVALGEKLSSSFYNDRKITQAFSGLRRYKFVRHIKGNEKNIYKITPKGEARLRAVVIDDVEVKTSKNWDGKWRLVMYDLPIRFKKIRNAFRWKLQDLGFFQFQKSVWIYPYPCEEEILFVADFYGVRKHIEILEVNKILDDRQLKTHFGF
ncbi:MAG: Repressor in the phenylacetic acid catabolism [Candidatus Nomurabacteria bacterium GW2011_GWA1_37_20]|uniref:Repressor in the phenylacetic acid catabolism n=2 Tax=Parcubacteria group TaxID=1794811 RepID=A0A0G0HWV7_9BACT|nr:MAG: Repressor in the phenylacetic acid catabolism [Candidatus Nomurabacteria bacterium GW2011_GWA1_37_20]KKQ46757.1 MAG: Repressor in the phenylacetic acid catabolism [Candidatus Yanofskybacteria bacterium GW2011_GWC2_37_9]